MRVISAVVLGVVFVLAGASKVARGAQWPAQAAQLRTPRVLIPLVPWWELLIGSLLITRLLAPWAAFAAAATLVVFTALLVVTLRRGEHPPCACFGGWSSKPLGWHHVARNTVLLAVAVVAIVTD